MKKYILTGGPCTGKTTILNKLTKRGFMGIKERENFILQHINEHDAMKQNREGSLRKFKKTKYHQCL